MANVSGCRFSSIYRTIRPLLALVLKEMYVSLPARVGAYGSSKHGNDESSQYPSSAVNGDRTLNSSSTTSHPIARGLSWREANERARILFYRGKHPSIRYDEQAAAFDVRMVLETASGGTQEIPVTDSDVRKPHSSSSVNRECLLRLGS